MNTDCSILNNTAISPTWENFFTNNTIGRLVHIENQIGENYNPRPSEVLRFASFDLNRLKVVIVGQDPYPQKGVPTGRAFEVSTLKSWHDPFAQVSIKNIIRNIYRSYYGELVPFSTIRERVSDGTFPLLPPTQLFSHWESEGVLLLNTYLTCEVGKPQSHREIWIDFAVDVVKYIVSKKSEAAWFMWGRESQQFEQLVNQRVLYKCSHPASRAAVDEFLNCPCFRDTHVRYGVNWINQGI